MKSVLWTIGLVIFLILGGGAAGFFWAKALYKPDLPSILQPLKDSMIIRDRKNDSISKELKKWIDKKPEIVYKIKWRELVKNEEAKQYFKMDNSERTQYFYSWLRALPTAPDSVR